MLESSIASLEEVPSFLSVGLDEITHQNELRTSRRSHSAISFYYNELKWLARFLNDLALLHGTLQLANSNCSVPLLTVPELGVELQKTGRGISSLECPGVKTGLKRVLS